MREITFSELFNIFHDGEKNGAAIAWDGGSDFAYIESLYPNHGAEWESLKISDLEKNTDDVEEILAHYNTGVCDDFQSFLKSLFSSIAVRGFCIWHEDWSGHSFGITRNSEEESRYWNHQPNGWKQWVGYGNGEKHTGRYLGRCRPNEKM